MKKKNNNYHFMLLGLTGSIASGKSTVAKFLEQHGAHIIDADQLAREVSDIGSPALQEISTQLGHEFINADGSLNRKKLAELVFNDQSAREELEAIMHPKIRELYHHKLSQVTNDTQLVVYVVPLLFEAKTKGANYDELDYNIVISASKEKCIERIIQRDNCSQDLAEKKYNSQMPIEEKGKMADFVIHNNGDLDQLEQQVNELYHKLI